MSEGGVMIKERTIPGNKAGQTCRMEMWAVCQVEEGTSYREVWLWLSQALGDFRELVLREDAKLLGRRPQRLSGRNLAMK